MLPVCCVQGAVQGSGSVLHILASGVFQLLSKHKYLPYLKRKILFPSRKSLWGDVGRSGHWQNSQPLGRSDGKHEVGSREQGTSTFRVAFFVKQCLHFIWRKACPARGSTAKFSSPRLPGHSMWKQSRGQEFYIMHKKRDGDRTAVTCCANHEL